MMAPDALPNQNAARSEFPEWLTVEETAALLRVSRGLVYQAIKSGQLSAVRLGRLLRLHSDQIDRLSRDAMANCRPRASVACSTTSRRLGSRSR